MGGCNREKGSFLMHLKFKIKSKSYCLLLEFKWYLNYILNYTFVGRHHDIQPFGAFLTLKLTDFVDLIKMTPTPTRQVKKLISCRNPRCSFIYNPPPYVCKYSPHKTSGLESIFASISNL